MSIALWIIAAVVSGLIAVLLTVLFEDALKGVLIDALGRVYRPRKRGIDGRWVATFTVSRHDDATDYVEIIDITQRLGLVNGRIVNDLRNYEELRKAKPIRPLRLRGEIAESFYLTGVWFHPLQTHRFMGSFQLLVDPSGRSMTGVWVGFSEGLNRIDAGKWVFVRDR